MAFLLALIVVGARSWIPAENRLLTAQRGCTRYYRFGPAQRAETRGRHKKVRTRTLSGISQKTSGGEDDPASSASEPSSPISSKALLRPSRRPVPAAATAAQCSNRTILTIQHNIQLFCYRFSEVIVTVAILKFTSDSAVCDLRWIRIGNVSLEWRAKFEFNQIGAAVYSSV